MQFRTVCGAPGIGFHVPSKEDRNVMVWVMVHRGDTQDTCRIIRPLPFWEKDNEPGNEL